MVPALLANEAGQVSQNRGSRFLGRIAREKFAPPQALADLFYHFSANLGDVVQRPHQRGGF